MSWLVNFIDMNFSKEGEYKVISTHVHLYNSATDRIFIDKIYSYSSKDIGECQDDVWNCVVEKLKKIITTELAHIIDKNRHHHH